MTPPERLALIAQLWDSLDHDHIPTRAAPGRCAGRGAASRRFQHPDRVSPAEDFTDPNSFFRFGREPKGFDILPAIPGVDFDAAWERRVEIVVDTATGLKANFISAEDLIASKLASGRPRDLADVDDIRKAAQSQRPEAKKKPPEPSGPSQ